MTQQFIFIILLIALGYFLKRINYLKASDSKVLSTIVFNVTLPSLIIVNLNSAELDLSLSILPIMMIVYALITKFIAILCFLKYDNQIRGTVGMMTASLNIGLFAYPLVEAIWPEQGLIYFGMADVGASIMMFGVTYIIGSYFSDGPKQLNFSAILMSLAKSVPLVTYIVMFTLNISHIHFPEPVENFFNILSQANMPLSMILLGLTLNFTIERKWLPLVLKYLGLHYGFAIVAGLLVAFLLPVDDPMIKTTLQVAWLLPVGVAIIQYTIQFRYKTLPFVAMTTNISIMISIVAIYLYQMFFV
ncbi:AEC family transporter [Staphylococcus auricularis]|uniref:AEC family transporter n=1 Tax=Staphylococcus auricularis TaxID=29379 RepID=UPI00242FB10F|nr:AEC family transporter [Staphylococcus auricularis]